jgi:tRNA A37 threonylcarbamoyladenosine modification protein TsaB
LAEVTGARVVPIGNLEALAFGGCGDLRAAVLDARRGQVFTALYDGRLEPLLEPSVGSWQDFKAALGQRPAHFTTIDAEVFGPSGPAYGERPDNFVVIETLADAVALLAEQRALSGEAGSLGQVEPVYVRRPDVREPE